jgi:hypothetical protein
LRAVSLGRAPPISVRTLRLRLRPYFDNIGTWDAVTSVVVASRPCWLAMTDVRKAVAHRSRFLGPEFITDPGTKDVSAEAYCFRDARHDIKENAAAKIGVQKFELSRQPW